MKVEQLTAAILEIVCTAILFVFFTTYNAEFSRIEVQVDISDPKLEFQRAAIAIE
jgi:hypothetical protein